MEFRDIKRQYQKLKPEIDAGIAEVINDASFISGRQVRELEEKLADYVGVKHCITCANGTDAISIALMAAGIGEAGGGSKRDVVFVPDFTFFSSGECPASVGAIPVFVDVKKDTYNIDASALEREIEKVKNEGELIPRAVIAVDLFGLPADYKAIQKICNENGLLLIEDGAQGFGGSIKDNTGIERRACFFGDISITSFFPAKPLGCYGDGGAIFTDNDEWAMSCRSIAVHGKDMEHPDDPMAKYNNNRIGMNSRLDTLQAAVLLVKLEAFKSFELEDVQRVATRYTEKLRDIKGLQLPLLESGYSSAWAQYTIQLPEFVNRDKVQEQLKEKGIPTMVYYVKPMHRQRAFEGAYSAQTECSVTDNLCKRVLCLPIYPYMRECEIEQVSDSLYGIMRHI